MFLKYKKLYFLFIFIFLELSPLFLVSEVSYDRFGDTTIEFIEEEGLPKTKRKLLLGVREADTICLDTSLLKL